jgi:plastocyanin
MLAAMMIVVLAGACGDSGGDSGGDTAPSNAAPPVSLSGTVSEHGTKALGAATELALELDDTYFGPTYITAKASTKITVTLTNEGKLPHTFTIDGTDVDTEVAPGKTATVQVTLPADGTVPFYCRFHRDGGMQGGFAVA